VSVSTDPDAPPRWRRRALEVFETPAYRRYFAGLVCVMSGFWVRIAALPWLVYEMTGSKDALGEIAAASLLPWIVISPFSGVLADRVDPRRLLQLVYATVVLANVGLGVALLDGQVGYSFLLAWTILTGVLRGVENPTRHLLVRHVVGLERLPNAIGMNAAGFHLTNATGFALAGWLYAQLGPAGCFFVVAALTIPMVVIAGTMPHVERDPDAPPRRNAWIELREGFAYVLHEPLLRRVIASTFTLVLVVLSWRTVAPALVKDDLGLDERGYGVVMAMAGVGSLLAALWVAGHASDRAGRARRLGRLALAAGLAVLGLSFSRWPALTGVAVLVAGFCQVGYMATANTVVQETVPDVLRGRVMGIWALMFGAAYPIGGWLLAALAERTSTSNALMTFGIAGVVGALLAAAYALRVRRRQAERATA